MLKYETKNNSLNLILPYQSKNECFFQEFYDEIYYPLDRKIHYKLAISKRNEWMIDNSDLLVCYIEKDKQGGALKSLKYAQSKEMEIINLAKI